MQIPKKMKAVILKGHDGMSKLEYKFDVDFSIHNKDKVLINIKGAVINNI